MESLRRILINNVNLCDAEFNFLTKLSCSAKGGVHVNILNTLKLISRRIY